MSRGSQVSVPRRTAHQGNDAAPYLHLRRVGERVEVRGTVHATLGHRIPRADGPDDGVFVEWLWDGHRLAVTADRYAMHPLYYFATHDEVAVSPSLTALVGLGVPLELDDDALSVFTRLGFFVDTDTPFRAIRALPPRGSLRWAPGTLDVSGGISICQPTTLSRRAAVDDFIDRFRAAMARRLPPESGCIVPLSGGIDSRYVVLELMAQGHRPQSCVTARYFPPLGDAEVQVAARFAAAVRIPHVILPQGRSQLAAELRKNELTDFCGDEHEWYLPIAEHLEAHTTCVYDGLGAVLGSTSSGFRTRERLDLVEAGRFDDLAGRFFRRRDASVAAILSTDAQARLSRERAIARLATELARHAPAPDPILSFHFPIA